MYYVINFFWGYAQEEIGGSFNYYFPYTIIFFVNLNKPSKVLSLLLLDLTFRGCVSAGMGNSDARRKPFFIGKAIMVASVVALCIIFVKQPSFFKGTSQVGLQLNISRTSFSIDTGFRNAFPIKWSFLWFAIIMDLLFFIVNQLCFLGPWKIKYLHRSLCCMHSSTWM